MKQYKAVVKFEGAATTITGEYRTKKEFIEDLRRNGYQVNDRKVKEAEVFDYIVENTDCSADAWKITKVGQTEDDIFDARLNKFLGL